MGQVASTGPWAKALGWCWGEGGIFRVSPVGKIRSLGDVPQEGIFRHFLSVLWLHEVSSFALPRGTCGLATDLKNGSSHDRRL